MILRNKWKSAAITGACVVVVAVLTVAGFRFFSHRSSNNEAELDNLRSLPYASWTNQASNRSLFGVTKYDRTKANPGYNVFTDDHTRAFLMDMDGNVVHQWSFDNATQCEFVRVFDNGDALGVCVGENLRKVDKNSKVIWQFNGTVNHDAEIEPDGTIIAPCFVGSADYEGRIFPKESLIFLSPDGHQTGHFSLWNDQGPGLRNYHAPSPLDQPAKPGATGRFEYYHLNSVQSLPETPLSHQDPAFAKGNLLISMRNTSLVCIIDRKTWKVVWTYGPWKLDEQHAPRMLPNGHILIFDNGTHRKASRVVELDPVTKRVVWRYPRKDNPNFFSAWRGNAQRLDNGNTLICEAEKGHSFEITPEGKTVWEFWSPFFNSKGQRLRVYRMMRISIDPSKFATGKPVPIENIPAPIDRPQP